MKIIHTCVECDDYIYAGEQCFWGSNGWVCRSCLEHMYLDDLLDTFDLELETAEEE